MYQTILFHPKKKQASKMRKHAKKHKLCDLSGAQSQLEKVTDKLQLYHTADEAKPWRQ